MQSVGQLRLLLHWFVSNFLDTSRLYLNLKSQQYDLPSQVLPPGYMQEL